MKSERLSGSCINQSSIHEHRLQFARHTVQLLSKRRDMIGCACIVGTTPHSTTFSTRLPENHRGDVFRSIADLYDPDMVMEQLPNRIYPKSGLSRTS